MVELLKDLIVQIHLISIYDDHKVHVMEVTVEMMMKLKLEWMMPMTNLQLTVVVVAVVL